MKLRFSILKDYSYVKRYAVKKFSFLERLLSSLKKRPKVKEEVVKEVEEKHVEAKGLDILVAKVFPILLFLAFIGFVSLKLLELSQLMALAGQAEMVMFSATPKFAHFVDSGTLRDKKVAFLQSLELSNASSFTVTPYFMTFPLSGEVYYFYNPQVQPSFAGELGKDLESLLEKAGFTFTKISSMEQFKKVPPRSIVIFPSDSLVPGFTETVQEVAHKGVLIILIAKDPNFELTSSLFSKPVNSFWTSEGVSFQVSDREVPQLNLRFISYEVPGAVELLGAAQYVTTSSGMNFIFIPASSGKNAQNYWDSAQAAAEDVSSIITEFALLSTKEETITYELANSSIIYANYVPGRDETLPERLSTLTEVSVAGTSRFLFSSVYRDYPGTAYFQQEMPILPYDVSKRDSIIRLLLDPKDEGSARVKMKLIDVSGSVADDVELNFLEPIQKSIPYEFAYRNDQLPEGRYLVLFYDANSNEIYAKTLLELGELNVSVSPNFEKATINFTFLVSGRPTYVGRATIKYGSVEKTFVNARAATLDLSDVFKGSMPAGTYEFEIYVEGRDEPLVVEVKRAARTGLTTFFTNPVNLFIIFLSVLIRLAGELLKRKEELPYSIDVPDFAPVDYETIEITKSQLLEAFEVVNAFYKWEITPLTLEEIKKGLSLVLEKPSLVINDFNLEIVLGQLVSEGLLIHLRDYYIPKKWLDKGFTAEQLVSFRMIRDMCVDLAIPFKKLTKSLPNTVLQLPWQEFWIYLYSPFNKEQIKRKVIKAIDEENVAHAIVFFDEDDMDKFETSLNDGTQSSSLLRSYIDNEKVYLFTINSLIETLKDVKS